MEKETDKENVLRDQVNRIKERSQKVRARIRQLQEENITEVDAEKKEQRRQVIDELESYSRFGGIVMEMYEAHKRGDITLEIKEKIEIEIKDEQ